MAPTVSILVPCFNAAHTVAATLESALGQDGVDCEAIAVDDGSSDSTLRVLEPFRDRGVTVVCQPNRGASAARNRALEAARGRFIQFLDADDILAPDKIARQLDRLEREPARTVASSAWARFTGDRDDARFEPQLVWRDQSAIEFLVSCALNELMFPPAAWLIPRDVCDTAGAWDESLSMNDDGEYMARALAASDRIAFCPEARVYYRTGNPASYGSRANHAAAESELRAWDSIVRTMLALENSDRVSRAAATGYQRIEGRYFGRFPDVVEAATRGEQRFGRGEYRFEGGPVFRALVAMCGWKTAMRLRMMKTAVRRGRARHCES